MKTQNNPPLCNVKDTKEFFSSAMKDMFSPVMKKRSIYTEGDVSGTLRNAIAIYFSISYSLLPAETGSTIPFGSHPVFIKIFLVLQTF